VGGCVATVAVEEAIVNPPAAPVPVCRRQAANVPAIVASIFNFHPAKTTNVGNAKGEIGDCVTIDSVSSWAQCYWSYVAGRAENSDFLPV
jgi:hypothetical protein